MNQQMQHKILCRRADPDNGYTALGLVLRELLWEVMLEKSLSETRKSRSLRLGWILLLSALMIEKTESQRG